MDQPETRYAKSGDVHIAYQVSGSGPFDLVLVPGLVSNLDLDWENPVQVHIFTRLGRFCRLIRFDKRGQGLSDRTVGIAPLEERMDDVRAVMDAVGSREAALFGVSEGGAMSVLFAATYPERTRALVLYGAFADYAPWVGSPGRHANFPEWVEQGWGTGISAEIMDPSRAADPDYRRFWARAERLTASPASMVALMRMNQQIDVRHIPRRQPAAGDGLTSHSTGTPE